MQPRRFFSSVMTNKPRGPSSQLVRSAVLFIVAIVLVSILSDLGWVRQTVMAWHLRSIANLSGGLLNLLGIECFVHDTVIASSLFSVRMVEGCDAVYPIALLTSAILAFPVSWRHRLRGIATGGSVLFVLNILRVASMFYIGATYPVLFERMHLVVWQTLFIVFTLLLFLRWTLHATEHTRPA